MALPYVCPKIKAKVIPNSPGYSVKLLGDLIADFDHLSPAKTFAKRLNSMWAWLGQSNAVNVANFLNAQAAIMTRAGSGDGSYRPPLNLV